MRGCPRNPSVVAVLVSIASTWVCSCYPVWHKAELPKLDQIELSEDLRRDATVLVLPMWENYKNESYEWKFFLAPPVFLAASQLPTLESQLRTYKDFSIVAIPHPLWISSHSLEGLYIIYADARVLWVASRKCEYSVLEHGEIGPTWKKALLDSFASKESVVVGALNPQETAFWRLPPDYVEFHAGDCEAIGEPWFREVWGRKGVRKATKWCFHNTIQLRMSSDDRLKVVEFIESLPVPSRVLELDRWRPRAPTSEVG